MNVKIKDMVSGERPRERLLNYGKENLSNEELISIILKTGTKNNSVKTLASRILSEYKTLENLRNVTVNKLLEIKGVGKVKAIELIAAVELGKRVYKKINKEKINFSKTSVVYEFFKDIVYGEKQELFFAAYLDTKNNLISYKLLFKGTINSSCVHPREIFKFAFLESAYSIIVVHNHPSGDATPSDVDSELTNHLFQIGNIIGIPILDHIIVGNDNYYSFYESLHKNK